MEPPLRTKCSIVFGYHLNTDKAHSVLEKGPNADKPEVNSLDLVYRLRWRRITTYVVFIFQAKAFREFWGEKSELRRFQDGSISEAVVWDCSNVSEKRKICEKIIKHVLYR